MDIQELVESVAKRVQQQVEADAWDALMEKRFSGLCEELFNQIELITHTVEEKLASYPVESVAKVWEIRRADGELHIRFGERELHFVPVGKMATLPGDRWTMQITRRGEELVGRYFVQHDERTNMLYFATAVEPVGQYHLLDLLGRELIGD
ncbi:hypothetical protein [Alicyclobacillus kakegawensis]|uniref:hypothetical protein n=1 Tax=Alicyclobacillus kakegawensis TaxID=392012 RepID=UPI0008306503|nr:hypothetical protein [Alicyclobacillus kakegawensis]